MAVDRGRNQSNTTAGAAYFIVAAYKLIYEYNILLYSLCILYMHKRKNYLCLAHKINILFI
jgi:hypothetical protein